MDPTTYTNEQLPEERRAASPYDSDKMDAALDGCRAALEGLNGYERARVVQVLAVLHGGDRIKTTLAFRD